MIHIVHIIPTLRFGGAERFVVDLVNKSDSAEFRYTIIVFFADTPLAVELNPATSIKIIPKHGQISWHLFGDLRLVLHELRPDIVHTHLFGGDLWGRVAAHQLGIPVVTTEHNINVDESFLKTFVKKCLRERTTRYVAVSEAIKNYMQQVYHITWPISIIRNGIEFERFSRIPPITISSDSLVRFLMLGRLVKQKGHRVALAALSELRNYPWQLRIVGDGEERGYIERLVRSHHLQDRVTIESATARVPEILAESEIFLMPSLWEGLGIAAMEAMAAGRLVIASDAGGLLELITHEKTGLLTPAGDVAALRDTLRNLFLGKYQIQKVAETGRRYAEEHFSIADMVRKYEAVYREF